MQQKIRGEISGGWKAENELPKTLWVLLSYLEWSLVFTVDEGTWHWAGYKVNKNMNCFPSEGKQAIQFGLGL